MLVQNPRTDEVMITNFVVRACGRLGKVGAWGWERAWPGTPSALMFSLTPSQLLSGPGFPFTWKGGPISCACGDWFSAAEMPPGGSVGVQQEADGTYTRIIGGVGGYREP